MLGCEARISTAVERYLARASAGPVLEALAPTFEECTQATIASVRNAAARPSSATLHRPKKIWLPRIATYCARAVHGLGNFRASCAHRAARPRTKSLRSSVRSERPRPSFPRTSSKDAAAVTAPKLPPAQFPHMRVDGCKSCSKFLSEPRSRTRPARRSGRRRDRSHSP